jgi:hypothetical protein
MPQFGMPCWSNDLNLSVRLRPLFRGDSESFIGPAILGVAGCHPVPAVDKAADL